jgi:hypothetical protein
MARAVALRLSNGGLHRAFAFGIGAKARPPGWGICTIRAHLVKTNRNKADLRPGTELFRYWPIDDAVQLDEDGRLVKQLKEAFDLTLQTFGV